MLKEKLLKLDKKLNIFTIDEIIILFDRIFIEPCSNIDSEFIKAKVKNLIEAAIDNNNKEIRRILIEELKALKPLEMLQRV